MIHLYVAHSEQRECVFYLQNQHMHTKVQFLFFLHISAITSPSPVVQSTNLQYNITTITTYTCITGWTEALLLLTRSMHMLVLQMKQLGLVVH